MIGSECDPVILSMIDCKNTMTCPYDGPPESKLSGVSDTSLGSQFANAKPRVDTNSERVSDLSET